jgi:hypothetical protein
MVKQGPMACELSVSKIQQEGGFLWLSTKTSGHNQPFQRF